MTQKLNDTQRKLVEDNHNLIYSFLNSHRLSLDADEDWYGTAAIGLCKAALAYDSSKKLKFGTLAYVCMENEVRCIMRVNGKCVVPDISLDYEYADESNNGCAMLGDVIPDNKDFYYPVYLYDAIELATKKISDRDKKIIDLVIHSSHTDAEIGKMFGVTKQSVSRIYRKFINEIRKYFND